MDVGSRTFARCLGETFFLADDGSGGGRILFWEGDSLFFNYRRLFDCGDCYAEGVGVPREY